MTNQEVCEAIEAETHTRSWAEATIATRLAVIASCINGLTEGSEQAAKKVVIKRKPRKQKPAPLTQHAMAEDV